ncbi:hypothetical protein PGB90_009040 [Kerria lacca]
MNIDSNLPVAWEPTKEHICDELMRANENAEADTGDDEGDVNDDKPPTQKEIIDALMVLWKDVQHRGDGMFFEQYSYERAIIRMIEERKKQTTLDNFIPMTSQDT